MSSVSNRTHRQTDTDRQPSLISLTALLHWWENIFETDDMLTESFHGSVCPHCDLSWRRPAKGPNSKDLWARAKYLFLFRKRNPSLNKGRLLHTSNSSYSKSLRKSNYFRKRWIKRDECLKKNVNVHALPLFIMTCSEWYLRGINILNTKCKTCSGTVSIASSL